MEGVTGRNDVLLRSLEPASTCPDNRKKMHRIAITIRQVESMCRWFPGGGQGKSVATLGGHWQV